MTRALSLESAAGRIDFGGPVKARSNVRGFGLPNAEAQWFEGAGHGSRYRGTRIGRRALKMTLKFTGADRAAVLAAFSSVALVIGPDVAPVRFRCAIDGEVWWTDVVRVGEADFDWDADTDGQTVLMVPLTFEAGDPYWTREDEESRTISPEGVGFGMLGAGQSLSQLRVSSVNGLGAVSFDNPGDVAVSPIWTAYAPFTKLTFASPDGVSLLEWTGSKDSGFIVLDTGAGTVVDEAGENLYGGLNDVPVFWTIPPGMSVASIVAENAEEDTRIDVLWNPKRWVLF